MESPFGIGGTCGQICCNNHCVEHNIDHCGTCDTVCGDEEVCGTSLLTIPGSESSGPQCGTMGGLPPVLDCAGIGLPF